MDIITAWLQILVGSCLIALAVLALIRLAWLLGELGES